MKKEIRELMDFLDASKSVYHAIDQLCQLLDRNGYTHLDSGDDWDLVPGGKYYVTRCAASVIAFRIPEGKPKGFMMSASHSDRPTFKIKENGELENKYIRLATERYGGMIMSTWMDRPLSVAGRLMVQTPDGVKMKLVDIDQDLMIMPNVAIHMNRTVNDNYKWNPATDTIPMLGDLDVKGAFAKILEDMGGGKVMGHDLFLYLRQKATVWGIEQEFMSAQALDDLQCTWGCVQGFLKARPSESIPVFCSFDSEEVGSRSVSGADSTFLSGVLLRIAKGVGIDVARLLSNSFMMSADNAHAVHPNHPELADPKNAPVVNGGVVVKFNANQKYTTDSVSAAVARTICERAGVPTQTYYNRPDIAGGSTLGYVSMTHVSVPTADIGLAQFAMHSCYETAGVYDSEYIIKAMTEYFSTSLTVTADGEFILK
ncbi:MAG: M18 family aminopeptidase [Oscillospiraceae bacterium]|nr:M18 family aminopeptidase [Oscillospiraceae bacterium]